MDAGDLGNRNACALDYFIDLVYIYIYIYIYIIYSVNSGMSMMNINPDILMSILYSLRRMLKSEISVERDLNLTDPNLIGHVCI